MNDVVSTRTARPPGQAAWIVALVLLAVLAGALTLWDAANGSRSDYYAAVALSMSRSLSGFFFGVLDPAGTVTLDKIPGSFWIPALAVRIFGFSTAAVVVPNALAAVAATLVTAVTARRLGGVTGGVVAGAVVASTPILVAVSRSNQPESFFVLALSLAAWAAVHAVRRAQLRWLMLAGVFVAVAFQMYMLEAWAVWPALAAAYLCTRLPVWRRVWHVAVAGLTSAALSVVWVAIVAAIPASARPYIGSTLHDDPWEMVFGYNGLGRFGQATADASAYASFTPPFSGEPGVLRLFNTQLAGQVGWLLPAALVAVVLMVVLRFRAAVWVLVGGWLVTFVVMFSVVAGMHQFYTAALAIPMALAIGAVFGRARRTGRRWPQAVLVTVAAATAIGIALMYGGYSVPVALAQAFVAVVALALLVPRAWSRTPLRQPAVACAVIGMLLTPAVWSATAIAHPSATNPVAGGVSDVGGGFGGFGGVRFGGGAAPGGGFDGAVPGDGAPGGGAVAGGMPGDGAPDVSGGTTSDDGTTGAPSGGAAPGDGAGGARPGSGAPDGGADGTAQTAPGSGGRFGGALTESGDDAELISYLRANARDARYLVAVFGAQAAAPLIIGSDGGSVMPIGGFSGNDPVPTLEAFVAMVDAGDVPYVLTSGRGAGLGGGAGVSDQILSWVRANCVDDTDAPVSGLYACGG
ncbi:ArnT family glycosyltransferase [Microbacterium luticocti]|uniref:ArnT family glycosyltransferase n=1 Tax=Microbacterium luticocti TaxID=451764 RepID=UPI0003F671DB|nr:glycosyltransferase family 39 protein [Microbacterium luticocti]